MDYEDSEKDYQRWTDGSGEGAPLANESNNACKGPDESLTTAAKTSDQVARDTCKEAHANDEPSGSTDVRMSEAHGPLEADES